MLVSIDDVFEHFGGYKKISEHLDLTRQAVWKWEQVPGKHAVKLAELSGGRFTVQQLLQARRYDDAPESEEESEG